MTLAERPFAPVRIKFCNRHGVLLPRRCERLLYRCTILSCRIGKRCNGRDHVDGGTGLPRADKIRNEATPFRITGRERSALWALRRSAMACNSRIPLTGKRIIWSARTGYTCASTPKVANRMLLTIATVRSGTIVLMQNVARTLADAT